MRLAERERADGSSARLIDRLYGRCKRLDDPAHTKQIFQGLITSADAIYHLTRKGPGRYLCTPKGEHAPPPYEVEIEDTLMKPLVSGAEAKRYVAPLTDTYLLFPYARTKAGVRLIEAATMRASYPKAWAYLGSYRDELSRREAKRDRSGKILEAPFDDAQWYRFGRHQNLDKQEIVKVVVPRLVAHLASNVDEMGAVYLDNVDVGGVVIATDEEPFFIAGVLNAPISDYIFRRISPLPIPPASVEQRVAVAAGAKALQAAHTSRRDILAKIARRLATARTRNKPETWLFPGLGTKRDLLADAPARLDEAKKRRRAEQRYELDLAARHDAITARLSPGAALSAGFEDGELSFSIDGAPAVDRIFVEAREGEFIAAQWKVLAATFAITDKTDGKKLATALRRLAAPDNPALVQQIVALEAELSALDADIRRQEAGMNGLVNSLYDLTEAEARMVAKG